MTDNSEAHSENKVLLLKKTYSGHDETLAIYKDDGAWRAIIKCDTCNRHHPIVNMDPSSEESMMFVEAEMQMHPMTHGSKDDGWHDGLGFNEDDLT